jgi:2-amino-4-hydroxy-6-hydroxymethyldihydropteridine diphosphokinase
MTIDTAKTIHDAESARKTNIFLGLGSNLGDREANLSTAIRRLTLLGLRLSRASSIYETEPVGYRDQPWFLNQVVEMEFEYSRPEEPDRAISNRATQETLSPSPGRAEALLRASLEIEADMGRERLIMKGPRVIDIDLLLFGELVLNYEKEPEVEAAASKIVVPHPRMHLRRFVLEPLCEIAAELVHPVLRKSYRQLLDELDDGSVVRLYS